MLHSRIQSMDLTQQINSMLAHCNDLRASFPPFPAVPLSLEEEQAWQAPVRTRAVLEEERAPVFSSEVLFSLEDEQTLEEEQALGEELDEEQEASEEPDDKEPEAFVEEEAAALEPEVPEPAAAVEPYLVHFEEKVSDDALLDKCWADAMLAMTKAPWEETKQQVEEQKDQCDHDYIFTEAIGTVCQSCGLVKLHIRDTFEFRRPYKRRRVAKKKEQENIENVAAFQVTQRVEAPKEDSFLLKAACKDSMYPHQKEGFKFLCKNLLGNSPGGVILAHAPGAGKSFVAVSFIQSYFLRFPGKRALVAVPKIVQKQWVMEFEKWSPNVPVHVCFAEDKSRLDTVSRWFNEGGAMIITHQLLTHIIQRVQDKYLEAELKMSRMLQSGPDILVLDEAHCARNDVTQVFAALDIVKTLRRIFLSGTVFQNNFDELYNFFKLCRADFLNCPEFFNFVSRQQGNLVSSAGLQQKFFKNEIENKIMNKNGSFSMQERTSSVLLLRRLTSNFLSWNSGDVLRKTLPGLEDFVLLLNMTEAHRTVFKRVKDSLDNPDALTCDHTMTLSAIHPCLAPAVTAVAASPKKAVVKPGQDPVAGVKINFVMQLIRYCHAHNEKVIVFSQWLDPLYLLKDMINSYSWGSISVVLEGKAGHTERQRVIDEFSSSSSSLAVLLASISACGEGITLVAASRVVILDTSWNPSRVQQAVARAHRIGQKRRVFVYRLLANETGELDKHNSSMVKFLLCKKLLDPAVQAEVLISLIDTGANAFCQPLSDACGDEFLNRFMVDNMELCGGVDTLRA